MKSFIFALTKQDAFPETIIFYNEGVKITTQESDTVNDLLFLDSGGVEIVNCGTCLDFFKLKDDLKVGSITNSASRNITATSYYYKIIHIS